MKRLHALAVAIFAIAPVCVVASGEQRLRSHAIETPLERPANGATCDRSDLGLAFNWPVDTTDSAHQIVDIETIAIEGTIVGWLYREQNGSMLIGPKKSQEFIPRLFNGKRKFEYPVFYEVRGANIAAYVAMQKKTSITPCFTSLYHPE